MKTRAVHLPFKMYREVRAIAVQNDRTVPSQLRVIIKDWKKELDTKK